MLIIDKYKDYYDHFSHIYGIDKKVVYDRRNSFPLTTHNILERNKNRGRWYYDKRHFFILEVGFAQYLFAINGLYIKQKLDTIYYKPEILDCESITLEHTFRENKHYFEKEITFVLCDIKFDFRWKKHKKVKNYVFNTLKEAIEFEENTEISNPILKDTAITSLIEPFEIWAEVSNYISSLNNDKEVDIKLTDVDKAINHGFDKKSSFRHPIK